MRPPLPPRPSAARLLPALAAGLFAAGAPALPLAPALQAQGAATAGSAAAPFALTLARPEAEFAEPFSAVAGVRELRDGRVVVADRMEKSVQLLDLARGTARRIGAEGGGPNEYALPMQLFALPGDSTLLFDSGNMRHLVITPAGEVARSFSTMDPNAPDMRLLMPRATDETGHLYFLDRGLRGPGAGPGAGPGPLAASPDSGTVLRYDPRTRAATPIGRVALPTTQTTASGTGGQQRVMMMTQPFAAQDEWTVGRDGRLAVVRHDPYRVEWVAPNGQRVVGPTVPVTRIRVTDRDKEALRAQRASAQTTGFRVTVGGPGGGGAAVSGGPPPREVRPPEPSAWPEFKPPFLANAAAVAPDGRLWVLRTRAAGDEVPSYDVFDGYGRLAGTVKLPPNARLVGFGRNSAYVVRTDEDDLQYLQRYKLF